MKKIYVLFSIAFALMSCNNEKGSANTDAARKQFLNECMAAVKKNVTASFNDTLAKEYCNCTADKVLPQLSQRELVDLGFGENPELQQRVLNMVQPCLEDYVNKSK